MTPLYYRGASIILVVYDVTNEQSMLKGVRDWVHELRVSGPDDAVLVLVGNKRDKENVLREVEEDAAKEYAEKVGALFFEASAKTGENVMNIFFSACNSLNRNKILSSYNNSNGVHTTISSTSPTSTTTWYSPLPHSSKISSVTPSGSINVSADRTAEVKPCCRA